MFKWLWLRNKILVDVVSVSTSSKFVSWDQSVLTYLGLFRFFFFKFFRQLFHPKEIEFEKQLERPSTMTLIRKVWFIEEEE